MRVNRRIGALFRLGDAWITRALAKSGLSSSSASLVLELAEAGPLCLTELSHRVGVDRAYVTRTVRTLEKIGFVLRESNPSDGRSFRLHITEQGRVAAAEAERAMLAWVAVITQGIEPTDVATTGRTLTAFYENAVRETESRTETD